MSARLAEIVDGNDVRMVQPGECLGFTREPLGEVRILLFFACQDFQRDKAVQAWLACLVHDAHATTTEAFDDFQLREQRCDFGGRGRRV